MAQIYWGVGLVGETLLPHLDHVARKYTSRKGEILPPSRLEHVAGNYKVYF